MSKAVLISVRPEWCELIANGKKTLEVRKTRPKLKTPFKCYIYCTAGNLSYPVKNGMVCHNSGGKVVIGEFKCDSIRCFDVPYPAFQKKMDKSILEQSCLTYWQLHRYAYHDALYGWHISDLVIYDRPKELREFTGLRQTKFGWAPVPISSPPQSWRYVEELCTTGKQEFIAAFRLFMTAQKDAETEGKKEFTCPLCGGNAWWGRSSYNGHLHCGCRKCDFGVME